MPPRGLTALALALALACAVAPAGAIAPGRVIELTDVTFDAEVAKGPTLVEVYADWCSHCKQLQPVWTELARTLKDDAVRVAKVNGPKCRALVKRLGVEGYPSIYYFRDGRAREYGSGLRTVEALAAFARTTYVDVAPMPFYRAPNSLVGRLGGLLFRAPLAAEEALRRARSASGFGDVGALALVLLAPVAVGAALIFLADVWVSRSARAEGAEMRRRREEEQRRASERPRPHAD